MRVFMVILGVALLCAGCAGRRGYGGGLGGWGAPSGSYRNSCTGIRVDGRLLKAACRANDGSWRNTSLDLRACDSNVVNDDGRLRCASGGWAGGPDGSHLPAGIYKRSCSNIRVQNGRLSADCRALDGSWKRSSVPARSCPKFANNDGRLVCQGGGR